MHYDHRSIEEKWRKLWRERGTYKVIEDPTKPKYYVLDMFPYPSGAGLHVGHPLGYIASDIVARHKRQNGFCVLHPMGYDAFGLPAEQYAIQTGQHPAVTTETNIKRYREQLDRIGFSFDWDREVRTSDPAFYKWTQWIFLQLFKSWYDPRKDKAEPIDTLIEHFELQGYEGASDPILTGDIEEEIAPFTASEWKAFDDRTKQQILQNFRLAYLSEAWVNWCAALGTVLANDEVKDGVSERGGHPVERKRMPQWSLRITAYAQRLLDGLDKIDWSDSIKEAQRNWIGRSEGALVRFTVADLTPAAENTDLTPSPSPKERGTDLDPRYDTINKKLFPQLKNRAKEMRRSPTEAEQILWEELRNSKLGDKFRRQHSIQDFIVDFVCLDRRLIVEVDGSIHDTQKDYDDYRTQQLEHHGFKLIRFSNEDVIHNRAAVLTEIRSTLQALPFQPWKQKDDLADTAPLSTGEGNGVRSNAPLSTGEGPGVRSTGGEVIEVFTTRPDTLFGVTFVTLAPEHELVERITTPERMEEVMAYVNTAKNRSERERQADVKRVSGVFTGAYCIHPFTGEEIPVWVGDYVLSGYGTGAVMAVPGGDQRDWNFAKHFGLPIVAVTEGADIEKEADERKDATIVNSGFLSGLKVPQAIARAIDELVEIGEGERRINYRLRDAAFGRQRYWGEPIPIYYKDGVPYPVKEEHLPLVLPEIDKYQPTETGEPPLARASDWNYSPLNGRGAGGEGFPLETTTMPGWAGSSWYFLRYMDPKNADRFAAEGKVDYWKQVDLYVGGSEHATGHLLYFRFWTKFLFDRGWIPFDEPAQKLVNQGMIQGVSAFAQMVSMTTWKIPGGGDFQKNWPFGQTRTVFVSKNKMDVLKQQGRHEELVAPRRGVFTDADLDHTEELYVSSYTSIHIPIELLINGDEIDVERFKAWRSSWAPDEKPFVVTDPDGRFICTREVEKMSKSKFNVVNPDDIIEKYGADTLRLYEMFLGPIEQSKPWDTNGIEGTFRFLRKFWNLFHDQNGEWAVIDAEPSREELKILHATLKKVSEDIDRMSFNTSVAQFMIAVNGLGDLKCRKRSILEPLAIVLSPFAPHVTEEIWQLLGHAESITTAPWPAFNPQYLVEDSFSYPISFNGKTRLQLEFPIEHSKEQVEAAVLANPEVQQRLEGKSPKKVIVVPKRIVNIVV